MSANVTFKYPLVGNVPITKLGFTSDLEMLSSSKCN